MTYRVRCKRRNRQLQVLRWARRSRYKEISYGKILKSIYPLPGSYEKPINGFTPNDKWEPKQVPKIMSIEYKTFTELLNREMCQECNRPVANKNDEGIHNTGECGCPESRALCWKTWNNNICTTKSIYDTLGG
jgi:hypothetical protein